MASHRRHARPIRCPAHRQVPQDAYLVRQDARHDMGAVRHALDAAAELIEDDPDAAAWRLDGVLRRIIQVWYARRGLRAPSDDRLLLDVERQSPPIAWRLRLALRAPDARARLAHLRGLLAAMPTHDTTRHPDTTPAKGMTEVPSPSPGLCAALAAAPRPSRKGT